MSTTAINLRLLAPTRIVLNQPVAKIVAEAENGFFCLLPRHIDFVAALVPGILYWTLVSGEERFAAIDEGILVKRGAEVLVSVLHAVEGDTLAALKTTVAESYRALDEDERRARSALARLEAATLRHLFEFENRAHG